MPTLIIFPNYYFLTLDYHINLNNNTQIGGKYHLINWKSKTTALQSSLALDTRVNYGHKAILIQPCSISYGTLVPINEAIRADSTPPLEYAALVRLQITRFTII